MQDRTHFRQIWKLTWPTLLHSTLEMTLGFVDLVMVRPFGPDATAAIGLSRQVTFLVLAAVLAISTGVVTLVSQATGAGDRQRVENVARQSLLMIVAFGVPTALVGMLISQPLLVAMQAAPEVQAIGSAYLRVFFFGLVFLWGEFTFGAIARGAADVLLPVRIAVVVNLLNVALNYVFIFGVGPLPAYGVTGAAIGTVAARAFGVAAFLYVFIRGTNYLRLHLRGGGLVELAQMGRVLAVGYPIALAGLFRNSSRLVFLRIVGASSLGVAAHAAVGIGLQVRLFAVLPALAFQSAAATLVGQAIGRGDLEEADRVGRRSVRMLAGVMFVVAGSIFLGARPLATLFVADAHTADVSTTVLRWFAVAQFFSALSVGTQGILIGAGDTKPAARYMLWSQWLIMLPAAYVLLEYAHIDPEGPLFAWVLAAVVSLLLVQVRFRRGAWRKIKL